jgi:ParB family transcriptional regulator, chromosome partitioning protein
MAKKIALGKGIASLIQDTPNQMLAKKLKEEMEREDRSHNVKTEVINTPLLVDVSRIKANASQPRKIFKEKNLEELANSILENGIIQPLIVMQLDGGNFELIAGERRLRAAKKAGLEKVPVVVKRGTQKDKMVMAIIENIQRSDLNCVEEALAYFQLMEDYQMTQDEVAKKLGKERSTIANHLRILKLPRDVIEMLQKELLTFGHAKVLAAEKERERIIRLANQAVTEQLSVRELEKLMKSKLKSSSPSKTNPFFDEKIDQFRQKLEQGTGFHFQIKSGKSGSGTIALKFNNEAEFNDIYEYLMTKRG